jgi:protein-disulfide isomerase
MNKENKNSKSNHPLLIIGAVLLAAIAGGWWFYSNSKSPAAKTKTNSTNTNGANKKSPEETAKEMRDIYNNAPSGAQPANMLGSPTATVTFEEFADYQCPTCAVVHPKVQEVVKLYGNRIKFIYRSFPLTQIHPHSYEAAVAAEAAGLQNKFWEMQTQLFSNQKEWANSADARKMFEGYASKIGLDVTKYQNDVLGMATKSRVDADMRRGRGIGINGTPSIYINGVSLPYDQFEVDSMRRAIDAELQKTAGQPTNQAANQATTTSQSNTAAGNAVTGNGETKIKVSNSK